MFFVFSVQCITTQWTCQTNLPSLLPFFPLGALTQCETHNLPSGGSCYLEEAHLCFTNCIFRSPSHTVQLTWHIPKISVLPLLLHGGTTWITRGANCDGKLSLQILNKSLCGVATTSGVIHFCQRKLHLRWSDAHTRLCVYALYEQCLPPAF